MTDINTGIPRGRGLRPTIPPRGRTAAVPRRLPRTPLPAAAARDAAGDQAAEQRLGAARALLAKLVGEPPSLADNPYAPGKWVYHREQAQALLDGDLDRIRPVTVELIPSNECLSKCAACPYSWTRRGSRDLEGRRFMSLELLERILPQLEAFGVKAIVNSGGGEPFMHPRLIDILREETQQGFDVGLFTNGQMITDEQAEALLIDIQPAFIRISLNAIGEKAWRRHYNLNRGDDTSFRRVSETIRRLARLKREHDSETTLGLAFIVGPKNVHSLKAAGQFIRGLLHNRQGQRIGTIDYAVFRPEVIYARHRQGGTQHSSQCFHEFMRIFEQHIGADTADIPGFQALANRQRFVQMASGQQRTCSRCLAHRLRLNVWWDGSVYLCTERNGDPRFKIGDLREQSLEEIWEGRRRRDVIARLDEEFHSTCPPICVQSDNNLVFDRVTKLARPERQQAEEAIEVIRTLGPRPMHANFL